MTIINADNIGIKFKLHREKHKTLKSTLSNYILKRHKNINEEFWALRNIGFTIKQGEVVGFIGRNGAGKSTLLRTIGKIYIPDEGYIKVEGTISTLLSLGVGFQPELTGVENIYLNGVLLGFSESVIETKIDNIIEFSGLGKFIDVSVKTYSSGMNARLGFSIALYLRREIMLIDEILGVGDNRFQSKCAEKINEFIQKGDSTILLVSHNLDAVQKYCSKVIWLEKGQIKSIGAPAKVIDEYIKL